MTSRKRKRWTRLRRASQFGFALFFLILPFLNDMEWIPVAGTLGSLRIGPIDLVEPAAGLASILSSRALVLSVLLGMALPVVLALVLGPVFCSWICPWGLISEGIDALKQKFVRRRWRGEPWRHSRKIRPTLLMLILGVGIVLGMPFAALMSAPRLITVAPLEIVRLDALSTFTGMLLLGLLIFEVAASRRSWCRMVCPAGSVISYLRTPRTLAIRFDESTCRCPGVAPCLITCEWGVDPRRKSTWDACTNCLRCLDTCPTGSLHLGFRNLTAAYASPPPPPDEPAEASI